MIQLAIHFLMISILFIIPAFLYRSSIKRMLRFYMHILLTSFGPKFYARILLLIVILFHFNYYQMMPGEYGVMISTVMIIYMFSADRTVRMIEKIRNSRRLMVLVFTLILLFLFLPHTFCLSVTLSYSLLLAIFFPPQIMTGSFDGSIAEIYGFDIQRFIDWYYS